MPPPNICQLWGHFYLLQVWGMLLVSCRRGQDAIKHPTVQRTVPTTNNYLANDNSG